MYEITRATRVGKNEILGYTLDDEELKVLELFMKARKEGKCAETFKGKHREWKITIEGEKKSWHTSK